MSPVQGELGPPPEDERREERPQRDDERGGLRPRVREPRVGEEVEAGEAERAEPEEPPASPVETEGAGAFDHGEHHEPQRRRERVPDRRQGEGVHALERRLAHDELAAPHDRGRRGEEHSQRGRPRPHPSPRLDCGNKRFQRLRPQRYFGDDRFAAGAGRQAAGGVCRSMNASTRSHASADCDAYSSWRRSKKLCGAPSYTTSSCSTPAAVSAASNAALCSGRMFASAPAWRARIGASNSAARCVGPGAPAALTGRPVEAHRPGEAVPARRRQPGVAAAEAEADGEHDLAAAADRRTQVFDGGADVLPDPLRSRLRRRGPCRETRRRACRLLPCVRSSRRRARAKPRSAKRRASSS